MCLVSPVGRGLRSCLLPSHMAQQLQELCGTGSSSATHRATQSPGLIPHTPCQAGAALGAWAMCLPPAGAQQCHLVPMLDPSKPAAAIYCHLLSLFLAAAILGPTCVVAQGCEPKWTYEETANLSAEPLCIAYVISYISPHILSCQNVGSTEHAQHW